MELTVTQLADENGVSRQYILKLISDNNKDVLATMGVKSWRKVGNMYILKMKPKKT